MSQWCDRLVLGGVLFLLVATPLAFGGVHPWAVAVLECLVFLLIAVWSGRTFAIASPGPVSEHLVMLRPVLAPLGLFIGLVLFQLCPLPPTALNVVSPGTYILYTRTLPGWPGQILYNEPLTTTLPSEESSPGKVLPTPGEISQSSLPPRTSSLQGEGERDTAQALSALSISSWRSLSPVPLLTQAALLKLSAYVVLFVIVVCYPVGRNGQFQRREPESRFFTAMIVTILFSGGIVALVGILQCLFWNGKLLWFFAPYDWPPSPLWAAPRAQGPFVNPSHFANYLSVIFPLSLVVVAFPFFFVPTAAVRTVRVGAGTLSFLIGVGVLLSNSRGGWSGLILGGSVALWGIWSKRTADASEVRSRQVGRFSPTSVTLVSLLVAVALALVFVGPSARQRMDSRLNETLQGEVSGATRVAVWQDTGRLIRDFPLLGVGFGAWSTVFPHYQRPALSGVYFREAHNDYVELAAATGGVGLFCVAWFLAIVVNRLRHGLQGASEKSRLLLVALSGPLGVMAFHEAIDFNLQIPANAVLLTVLLGLVVRLAHREIREKQGVIVSSPHPSAAEPLMPTSIGRWERVPQYMSRAVVCGGVCLLLVLTLHYESMPYPYHLQTPVSLAEARAAVQAYPTHVPFHLAFVRLAPGEQTALLRQSALEAALWLEPGNARARDLYAATLFRQGKRKEGREQTTLAVFYTPETQAHMYLNPRIVPWLPPDEQAAIEEGLRQAVIRGRENARATLGQFYGSLKRFHDQAGIYEEAARAEYQTLRKVSWLLQASQAYRHAQEEQKVEQMLRTILTLTPDEQRAYHALIIHFLEASHKLDAAKATVIEGIAQGVDPFGLWLSFAEGARTNGYRQEAKEALSQALTIRPESREAHEQLGYLYLQERNFDRAALIWRKVTTLDPSAASAFFHLGIAERGRYRFFEAEKALLQALALQPNDPAFQREYTTLRELMEKRTSQRKDHRPEIEGRRLTTNSLHPRPHSALFTHNSSPITFHSSSCVG